MTKSNTVHDHNLLVGLFGLAAGLAFLLVFPKFKVVAGALFLLALFHLAGLAVLMVSTYFLAPEKFRRTLTRFSGKKARAREYDFGWTWGAMNGHLMMAGVLFLFALALQLEFGWLWPVWFLLALLGVALMAGGLLLRTSKRPDFACLPMVDLIPGKADLVLDAGCGAGRTTLAISKVLGEGRVVALDRFDAYYIDGGGRALLERNLGIAGLSGKVDIVAGDIVRIPFPDGHFDAIVSTHVIDHMKDAKLNGLQELFRVLKPGGRFLMVVWVPGLATFLLANVFSLGLTSTAGWRKMTAKAGFTIHDEGTFNGMAFFVLEKPL